MVKTSVLIPSRNEKYLIPTVNDVLSKAAGEVEAVVVLEDYGKPSITPLPDEWAKLQAQHGDRLHTIYHHDAKGMRPSLNEAAASAISRGSKYLLKLDAHCMVDEGWDEKLKADCDSDWIVVPRRKRLDPTTWTLQDAGKPDIDYHYLSFPDDPNDFGGPGLNGKPWTERIKTRLGKPEYDIDDEMSSQGSGWFMHADYFQRMGFLDTTSYGPFWNEFQELGLCCWLSGGQVKVNKRTWYAHWHKGRAGVGYHKPEKWLTQGRNHTMKWIWNEAYGKQTRPFEWLIDHFWPVPSWPENWREVLYAERKPRVVTGSGTGTLVSTGAVATTDSLRSLQVTGPHSHLTIHSAHYGPTGTELDVTEVVRGLVTGNTLDLMVGNTVLGVGNPFRGQKKRLVVRYEIDGGVPSVKTTDERDWLIIGQSERWSPIGVVAGAASAGLPPVGEAYVRQGLPPMTAEESKVIVSELQPRTATALNDYLVRKFSIPSHRLRGPMPIELPHFHRDDLAQLFAELGFTKGAEIGVAEGKYSEVLVKANPDLHLLCVDPWDAYDGNKQQKTKEKHELAYAETQRRLVGSKAQLVPMRSMDVIYSGGKYAVEDGSLDFCYLDANHSYDYFMEDLINWGRKVRSGGIVAGDDVYRLDPKRWGAGPMEGIYHYTQAHHIEPWFLINAHKSVDFFFVKP